jgi:hypothetical protein
MLRGLFFIVQFLQTFFHPALRNNIEMTKPHPRGLLQRQLHPRCKFTWLMFEATNFFHELHHEFRFSFEAFGIAQTQIRVHITTAYKTLYFLYARLCGRR